MPELSESRLGETTGPLIRGWGLDTSSSEASFAESVHSPRKSPPIDLSFHMGEPDEPPSRARSFAATRSISPSQPRTRKSIPFPEKGDIIGGFRVVSELGRGAFARVYLAEQVDLSGRLVALKVAEALGDEPQALARLQHAHIVQIFSIHDDPATGLRILCMPYVGGANLAQVLERSGERSPTQADGRSLVEALDHVGGSPPTRVSMTRTGASRIDSGHGDSLRFPGVVNGVRRSPTAMRSVLGRYLARVPWWKSLAGATDLAAIPAHDESDRDQPARRFLRSHTYVQAAVWIAAKLAEGLDHAHARGILHRDIKPSNILIASDGTPMLLDFNLAAEVQVEAKEDGGERARLGGTLPYMAPEHLDAFNPMGGTEASAVDERSDIYALGLILFEMVAGRHPFDDPPPGLTIFEVVARMTEDRRKGAPSARSINPAIPRSLDAIIAKSLDPEPSRRYARASELAEDIQRFLEDCPNVHAPEPSLRERAAKWYRRHPKIRGAGPVAAIACAMILGIFGVAWSIADYAEGARAKLRRASFRDEFIQCQLLLNTTNGPDAHHPGGIAKAEALLKLYGVETDPSWLKAPMARRLPAADRTALREEVSELMILLARARVAVPGKSAIEPVRRAALLSAVTLLDRAEAIDPRPSSALFETRARMFAALGEAGRAAADRARAAKIPPASARDFYLRGTARAALGELDGAESDLGCAVALEPQRFWAWFVLGLCHYDTERYADAAGDFSACTLLSPNFAWPYVNRGLALAAAGRTADARASYDRALALSPNFIEARVDRAYACLILGDPETAERDLARAIALGNREAGTLAARAEALSRLGRRDQAEREFAAALEIRPNDAQVLVARGVSRIKADPVGAVADFTKVLERDPRNSRAHYGYALFLREKDRPAAIRHASDALDAAPNAFDALRLRAVLLGREGDPAAEIDAARLARNPSAQNLYNAACALALLDAKRGTKEHRDTAREDLRRAFVLGFPRARAETDPDLDTIRD